MNIDRRLEQMRERLERSRPARMTVTFANGEVVNTDPISAWDVLRGGISAHPCGTGVDSPPSCGPLPCLYTVEPTESGPGLNGISAITLKILNNLKNSCPSEF